jgi:hypothetical protein
VNIARQIWIASSSRSIRSRVDGQSYPYSLASFSFQAAPIPKMARPPEITSSVVTILARSDGLRYVTPETNAPSLTRDVPGATAPSNVYASNMGCSGGPMLAICWKWSITNNESNPESSAAEAISLIRSNNISSGRPGKVKLGSCSPNLIMPPPRVCEDN